VLAAGAEVAAVGASDLPHPDTSSSDAVASAPVAAIFRQAARLLFVFTVLPSFCGIVVARVSNELGPTEADGFGRDANSLAEKLFVLGTGFGAQQGVGMARRETFFAS
jgi:hypothetical protein